MFGTGILRRATKVVVYTALPVAGPLKVAAVGTRRSKVRSKKQLKELQKQTAILEKMAAEGNRSERLT